MMKTNFLQKAAASLLLLAVLATQQTTAQSSNWNQVLKAVASDRSSADQFGHSVAISGSYAVVGAFLDDDDASGGNNVPDAGSVYVFQLDASGNWQQVQKLVASDRAIIDRFGNSVAISDNYLVVGAEQEDEDANGMNTLSAAGSVYVFERDMNGMWIEAQKLVASDRAEDDQFGNRVAISDRTIVIGALNEDEDANGMDTELSAGSVYVFERNRIGVWTEAQKLVASDRAAFDLFGTSIAISDNTIAVGAFFDGEDANGMNTLNNAGSAYVFERDNSGVWTEVQKLVASDRAILDIFGTSIAISGNTIVVGTEVEDEDANGNNTLLSAGSAYVFERDNSGVWTEVQKLVASDRAADDRFGVSVAMSGNFLVVGANQEDEDASGMNTLSDAGSAYVFERDSISGMWTELQKITASDRAASDEFGISIAISGNTIVVGAERENEDANGMNTLSFAGSAYFFEMPLPLVATLDSTNALCNAMADGSITANLTGGTAPYSYRWSNGDSTINTSNLMDTIMNLSAGTYTLSVSDANGQMQIAMASITEPVALAASTMVDSNATCNGLSNGGATASATGGTGTYTYLWSNSATTASIAGVVAGTYTITVTDANGCIDTSSVSITEPDTIAITTSTDVACNGEANGSATASATGGTSPYTYAWSNSATTASITGVVAGIYTITVTDANGCTAIDSAAISEPVFDLSITIDTSLTEGTITAVANANGADVTYQWLDCNNNSTPISGETNQGFTIPESGSYAVELTQNGCVDTSECINLINVSIAENSLESNMHFYPNPTNGEFSIELGQEYKNLSVVVRNAIGQQVAASSYTNTSFINLVIEGDAGLYFVELTANAGLQTVIKVVKQ